MGEIKEMCVARPWERREPVQLNKSRFIASGKQPYQKQSEQEKQNPVKIDDVKQKMTLAQKILFKHIGSFAIAIGLLVLALAVYYNGRYQQTGGAYILDTHTGAISTFADAPRIGR